MYGVFIATASEFIIVQGVTYGEYAFTRVYYVNIVYRTMMNITASVVDANLL